MIAMQMRDDDTIQIICGIALAVPCDDGAGAKIHGDDPRACIVNAISRLALGHSVSRRPPSI